MCTEKIKKRERVVRIIQEQKPFLKCPICSKPLKIELASSLTCKKGHSYDFSKKGTINFLGNGCKLTYSKELFEARNAVCEAGFYDPLIEELAEVVSRHQQKINRKISVLDIGCGEGSHISGIFGEWTRVSSHYLLVWIYLRRAFKLRREMKWTSSGA